MKKSLLLFTSFLIFNVSKAQNTFPASGNVGIGTTSPNVGSLQIAAPDQAAQSAIAIRQSNNAAYGFDFALDQTVNGRGYWYGISGNTRTSLLQFDRNSNYVLFPSGNVGIGANSDIISTYGESLAVQSKYPKTSLTYTNLAFFGSNDANNAFGLAISVTGASTTSERNVSLATTDIGVDPGGTMTLSGGDGVTIKTGYAGGGGTSRFTVNSSGNVGIGTINPGVILTARSGVNQMPANSGNAQPGAALRVEGGNNAVIDFGTNNINTWIQATDKTSLDYNYNLNFNPNGGNVGIGTVSPTTKLEVNGETKLTHSLSIRSNYINSTEVLLYKPNNNYYDLVSNNNNFQIYNGENNSYVLSSDRNDNVGIGTIDTKGYKLAINGSAIATSIIVKAYPNWPDYVFKKNYNLPELSDVKNYIDKNHHLSEIPSAAQMEKNGVDLGEMNIKLLKKVEELTLYLIDQQKQINRLKIQIRNNHK